jgi:HPr kinase/phosphorylase
VSERRPEDHHPSEPSQAPQGITVGQLLADASTSLELSLGGGRSALDRVIRGNRVQKSGLVLVGHFHGIDPACIQILGVTELTYLQRLSPAECAQAIHRLMELDLCCVIVTQSDDWRRRPRQALDELLRQAAEADTPVLLCRRRSSRTIAGLHALLDESLAPRTRIHGVLLDVFEVGLLVLGESGAGKSEVALELVMRGHRLVADDVVECHRRPPGIVLGQAADLLRHHLEVRGLGILNIKDLFGVTAVRESKRVDVVVQLSTGRDAVEVDRLGLDRRYYSLLDVDIPELLIAVRPGRDIASILEIAARNELLKQSGRQPDQEFLGRFEETILDDAAAPPEGSLTIPEEERTIPGSLQEEPLSGAGLDPATVVVDDPQRRRR